MYALAVLIHTVWEILTVFAYCAAPASWKATPQPSHNYALVDNLQSLHWLMSAQIGED